MGLREQHHSSLGYCPDTNIHLEETLNDKVTTNRNYGEDSYNLKNATEQVERHACAVQASCPRYSFV